MREYTGPTEPPKPPAPARRRSGWMELDDQPPCQTCGENQIRPYNVMTTLGGQERTTLGAIKCRNGCLPAA